MVLPFPGTAHDSNVVLITDETVETVSVSSLAQHIPKKTEVVTFAYGGRVETEPNAVHEAPSDAAVGTQSTAAKAGGGEQTLRRNLIQSSMYFVITGEQNPSALVRTTRLPDYHGDGVDAVLINYPGGQWNGKRVVDALFGEKTSDDPEVISQHPEGKYHVLTPAEGTSPISSYELHRARYLSPLADRETERVLVEQFRHWARCANA